MGLFGNKRAQLLDYTSAVNPAPNPMRDPLAGLGGYDRNAAMQGQSGFAPMNQGFEPPAQKKPGFFSKGGAWLDVLGAFGDGFGTNGPVYAQSKMQRGKLMQEQQMAEQRQQQEREDFIWKSQYERANPKAPQPTEFERLLEASGLEANQKTALLQDFVRNRANPVQGVPFTDESGNTGLQFIRPNQRTEQPAVAPTSEAEYKALPPGAQYRAPDGSIRTKGGSVGNGAVGF